MNLCCFSWDDAYSVELENFENHKDEGEIWFGEDSLFRVIRWFERNVELVPTSAAILDLGCGNGLSSIYLAKEGYTNITGVDYSDGAIELSRKIAKEHGEEAIKFEVRSEALVSFML